MPCAIKPLKLVKGYSFPAPKCMTRDEKRQRIREEMLRKRDSIPSAVRHELSRIINTRTIDFIETQAINSVMLYLSIRSEVDTHDLLAYLLRTNKIALAPAIEAKHLVPRRISNTSTQLKPEVPPQSDRSNYCPGNRFRSKEISHWIRRRILRSIPAEVPASNLDWISV